MKHYKCIKCSKIFTKPNRGRPSKYCTECANLVELNRINKLSKQRHLEAIKRSKQDKIKYLNTLHKRKDLVSIALLKIAVGMTSGETQTLTADSKIRKEYFTIYAKFKNGYYQYANRVFLDIYDIIRILKQRLKNKRNKRFWEYYKIYVYRLEKISKIKNIKLKDLEKIRRSL